MATSTIYIISAPSGGGKTTLVNEVINSCDNLCVSISHTTRSKRQGEVDGEDYYFIKEKEFLQMAANNSFIEYAKVFGNYYGTSYQSIDSALRKGDVILEIDWQGAKQIIEKQNNCISVFVLPPSIGALEKRLKSRNLDSKAVIEQRLTQAKLEISNYKQYDYLILNDNLEQASYDLKAIIRAQRLKKVAQSENLGNLIQRLVS